MARRATSWDAESYDRSSGPQQSWAADVLARLDGLPEDATVLDIGCGTGRVTELLAALVPHGSVLAIDASEEMVGLARRRLGVRAHIWREDVLDLELASPVDAILSTATLHWVRDHDRLWQRVGAALGDGGRLEVQCGGEGNIARVKIAIAEAARETAPDLEGWSPWCFAGPSDTEGRLRAAGFTNVRCWLEERPTYPDDLGEFVRTSILPAHIARLPAPDAERFASAVVDRLEAPLDYVRLNVSAVKGGAGAAADDC